MTFKQVVDFLLFQSKLESELPVVNGYRFGWVDPRKTMETVMSSDVKTYYPRNFNIK
jgi:hypothetical protein